MSQPVWRAVSQRLESYKVRRHLHLVDTAEERISLQLLRNRRRKRGQLGIRQRRGAVWNGGSHHCRTTGRQTPRLRRTNVLAGLSASAAVMRHSVYQCRRFGVLTAAMRQVSQVHG